MKYELNNLLRACKQKKDTARTGIYKDRRKVKRREVEIEVCQVQILQHTHTDTVSGFHCAWSPVNHKGLHQG